MVKVRFERVLALPSSAVANTIYFVKPSGAQTLSLYVSGNDGVPIPLAGGTPTPAPSFTTQPTITGTVKVGQPLSTLTYNDGTAINGTITTRAILLAGVAKAGTYVLVDADLGKAVTYQNIATGVGASATATSASVTVQAADVTGPATLDSSLSSPILAVASSNSDGSAPSLNVAIQPDYGVGDTVRVYRRDKAGALIQTYTNTIDASEATDTSAGTSGKASFGLSTIPAGTWRYTSDVLKAGGATYGPISNQLTIGPDDVAPVLSAPTTGTVGATSVIYGFTTDEGNGTAYTVFTDNNVSPNAAQVKGGQKSTGAAAQYAASMSIASTGAKTATATGLTASSTYYRWHMHEDATGNQSNVLTGGSATTGAAATSIAKLNQTTGTGNVDRNTNIVSTDGLTATVNSDQGAPMLIKSADAPPTKFRFEVTVNAVKAGSSVYLGVTDAADAVGPAIFNRPGNSGQQKGFTLPLDAAQTAQYPIFNGGNTQTWVTAALAAGLIFAVEVDTTATPPTITVKQKNGSTVTAVNTASLTSQIPTNWRAFVGGRNNTDSVTVNFGASAWAITPTTGFVGW